MEEYEIEFTHRAFRQFQSLQFTVQKKIGAKVELLRKDPRQRGIEKLEGIKSAYRLRVGDYRVVFEVLDEFQLVRVVKVGHRRDVYRGL
jgi:mRNA interferase RelE/StbE